MGSAFSYAWNKFKANAAPLVLITLVLLVGVAIVQAIGNGFSGGSAPTFDTETGQVEGGDSGFAFFGAATIVSLLFAALSIAVQLVAQSAIIKGALALTRGQGISVGSAFNGINWGQVVLTAIISSAIIFVGLLLCILPGLVAMFLLSYAMYFVIDRDMPAVDAIKASVDLVKNNVGVLILFFLASLGVTILGACACLVGLLVALPVVTIAQAYTFRTLTGDPVTA